MQRQRGADSSVARPRRHRLDRKIVGDQRDGAAVGHPVLQLLVAAVEPAHGVIEQLLAVGLLVHLEQHSVEARAEADEIALLDDDLVLLHDAHQIGVADHVAARGRNAPPGRSSRRGPACRRRHVLDAEMRARPAPRRTASSLPRRVVQPARRCRRRRGSRCRTRSRRLPSPSASNIWPTCARLSHCVEYCSVSTTTSSNT